MVFELNNTFDFPDPRLADPDGLLATGGDLNPERIIQAYKKGIFPWFSAGDPILWWSPDPRLVLFPDQLKISRSLSQTIRSERFSTTMNTCFPEVIRQCSNVPRPGQDGTWITRGMIKAYTSLHRMGYARSVEVWKDGLLAGGLYGIEIAGAFFGESMFYTQRDASKIALFHLVRYALSKNIQLIDCQMTTTHLLSLGAIEIPREKYLKLLSGALKLS